MDAETKKPKRVTRSQQSVVDEPNEGAVAAPKKSKSRSKKSKKVSETDGDDFDDSASSISSSSTSSVRDCKVILQRENFDEHRAHSTRARSSSQLTEENVAAHLNPARRALRSSSIASDGTGSTKSRTTRSTRLTASQNTPKKEVSTSRPVTPSRPATPARRSSRLLSENEKPAVSPAKRNLRSNSVASVDEISPQPVTRTRSSRSSESQSTPAKTLKTKVSKIKTEPTTPRRASSRFNKSSVLPDIIDEESSDDEKTKKDDKKMMNTVEEEEKTVAENEAVPDNSMQVEHDDPKDGDAVVQKESSSSINSDKSPIISSTVSDEIVKSVTIEPIDNAVPSISITMRAVEVAETEKAKAPIEQKVETPVEPMETSMTELNEQANVPKEKNLSVVDNSDEHGTTMPETNLASDVHDSMDANTIANEETSSPLPNKSKKQPKQQQTPTILETVQVKIEKPTDADAEEIPTKSTNIDDTLTAILNSYTPKPKPRPSEVFKAMDVSALIHDENLPSSPAPASPSKQLKVSSKRLSLNSSIQSTGFDKMEVSALAADLVTVEEETDKSSAQKEAAEEVSLKETANEATESPPRKTRLSVKLLPSEITPTISASELSKIKTPKAVTSKVGTGFDKMEVSALAADLVTVEEKTDKSSAQKEAAEEASLKEMANENAESPPRKIRLSIELLPSEITPTISASELSKIKTPKAVTLKVGTPQKIVSEAVTPKQNLSVTRKSNASPKKTPISMQATSLTPLVTPTAYKDLDNSFDKIADHLTPGYNQSSINKHIDELLANMTADTSTLESATSNANDGDQMSENCIVEVDKTNEKSMNSDQQNVSVVNETQLNLDESGQTEKVPQEEPKSIAKSMRKSVQIMTPKIEKTHSAEKRVDTPYPTKATIPEGGNSPSEFDDAKKTSEEVSVKDGEKPQKFGESWSKPIRQVSLTYDSPKPIDALGTDTNDKIEVEPQKKAVPVKNNWSVGLVDSESEDEIVPDSEGGEEEEEEEEEISGDEQSDNEFLIDEAVEAGPDYQSGDSMDSSERREAEENEIVENGEDLGSEDSEEEDMEDDSYDSQDSFLNDSEDNQVQCTDDEEDIGEQIAKSASKRRRSRMIVESSTDDDSNSGSSIDGSSNDVVIVSVQGDSVVVLAENNEGEEKIVEGKTFATTYLLPDNDVQQTETHIEKSDEKESAEIEPSQQPETMENEQVVNENVNDDKTTSAQTKTENDEVASDLTEKPESMVITETVTIPDNTTSTNEVKENVQKSQAPDSDVIVMDGKNEEPTKQKISLKKHRATLSGIDSLSKPLSNIGERANRMSLGNLDPNQQYLRGEILDNKPLTKSKAISSKINLIENENNDSTNAPSITEPEQIKTDERESNMDASTSSIENLSPNHSKAAPLNISSQEEENNNRKSSPKKSKADETIQSDEIISTVSEHVPATETNDSAKKKKARSKRKFEEVDIGDDDQVRTEPKKLLKIINTASGVFLEEPMTPEKKNKFAFQVTPLTPVNQDFRVHRYKSNKRKSMYIEADDPMVDELLPKPKWKIDTQFEAVQPHKRARKLDVGSTEMILKPLESKKKSRPTIPDDVRKFRHRQMYRSDVPREDKRAQLRLLHKKRANFC